MSKKSKLVNNPVNRPAHYCSHPSGVEAIEVCGYMGFNTGNAFKYLFRFENKWSPLEDLRKSRWYINREYFQQTGKTLKMRKGDKKSNWDKDSPCLCHWHGHKMVAIIGDSPRNIEKALFYIWHYENFNEPKRLRMARLFVDLEITKRTKKIVANKNK
jgi:hypothetical protein